MDLIRRFHSHLFKVSKCGKYVIHYLISFFFHFFFFLSLLLSLVICFWILNNLQRNLGDTSSKATVTQA